MRIKWRDNLAWQQLGEEIVIIDSRLNKEVHRLNSLGSVLWKEMKEPVDESALYAKVLENYEIGEEEAKKDINDFLLHLKDKNLIEEE